MLAAGLMLGLAVRRLRLPRLAGELAAGVLLGPSILGLVAPRAEVILFPHVVPLDAARSTIVQFGLAIFLFAVGSRIDLSQVRSLRRRVVLTGVGGIAVPFAVGYVAVFVAPGLFAGSTLNRHMLALVVGTILSISSIPVIAKILSDLDLLSTDAGAVVMASATVDDVVGWSLFAVILGAIGGKSAQEHGALMSIVNVVVLFAFTLTVGRKLALFLSTRMTEAGPNTLIRIASTLGMSSATEAIGLGSAFGAFLAGVAFAKSPLAPNNGGTRSKVAIDLMANEIFAPLYFVSVGLQADFVRAFNLPLVLFVIVAAVLGKLIGATAGARAGGASTREALAVGFGLNARGAMAIVLVSTALDRHVVTESVFVAVVVMSLVTSLVGGPAMLRLLRNEDRKF